MIHIVLNYTFIKIKNHIAPKKIVLIQYNILILCVYISQNIININIISRTWNKLFTSTVPLAASLSFI